MKIKIYLKLLLFSILLQSCLISHKVEPFKPNKQFLQEQPNYETENSYDFSNFSQYPENEKTRVLSRNYSGYPAKKEDYAFLNSREYPVKKFEIISNPTTEKLKFWFDADLNRDIYGSNYLAEDFVKIKIKNYYTKHRINPKDFYPPNDKKNIYLSFISNRFLMPKAEDRKYLPRTNIYEFIVKDYKLNTIKKYQQVVFTDNWGAETDDYALESLLGQFTQDKEIMQYLASLNSEFQNENEKTEGQFYVNEVRKQQIIKVLKSKYDMKSLADNLEKRNDEFATNSAIMNGLNQIKYSTNTVSDNNTEAVANSVMGLIDVISSGNQRAELEKNRRAIENLTEEYTEINNKQKDILKLLSQNGYLNLENFKNKLGQDETMLEAFRNSASNNIKKAKNQISISQSNTQDYLNQNMNMINEKNKSSNSETSAISNDNGNSDCSVKSTNEWKQTSEYQKCNSTSIVGKTQYDCEYAKAKLIEIKLNNCRSQLPQSEIQQLEKTKQDIINRANQMKKDGVKINH